MGTENGKDIDGRKLVNHLFAAVSVISEEVHDASVAGQCSDCSLDELCEYADQVQVLAEESSSLAKTIRIVARKCSSPW